MKSALIVLAFNEESTISDIVAKYSNEFNTIVVINDCSTDGTLEELKQFEQQKNIKIINNKKNLGAGKSFDIALDFTIKQNFDFVVKIDGDDQFLKDDVIKIRDLQIKNLYDFIKCDRFWEHGVVGEMPFIRYLGNTLASLMIKFTTGFLKVGDPLNGLFSIKTKNLERINLPKQFHRYGYPFYYTSYFYKLIFSKNIKVLTMHNTIFYRNETSYLSPLIMFQKLIRFTIKNKINVIIDKIKISKLQPSAILDIVGFTTLLMAFFSIYKVIFIRYFNLVGSQTNWIILLLLFFVLSVLVFISSLKIQSKSYHENFNEI